MPWFRKELKPPPLHAEPPVVQVPAMPLQVSPPLSNVRFIITGSFWVTGAGAVLAGELSAGRIAPGMTLRLWKSSTSSFHPTPVQVIEMIHKDHRRVTLAGPRPTYLETADPGPEPIGLRVQGLQKGDAVKGDFLLDTPV